jgi:hypothetical protein
VPAEHAGHLPPTVDRAQLDLTAGHETEEQHDGHVFARQRALRFNLSAKFLVKPLNRIRRAQRLPLGLEEDKEREQLVAAFSQTRHHSRAALSPCVFEGRESSAGRVGTGRVDDAVEVVADLGNKPRRATANPLP